MSLESHCRNLNLYRRDPGYYKRRPKAPRANKYCIFYFFAGLLYSMQRELTGLRGCIRLARAGVSEPFNYTLGGVQGGVATADEFTVLLERALDLCAHDWHNRRLGFTIDTETWTHAV